jgi:hypothetical protein
LCAWLVEDKNNKKSTGRTSTAVRGGACLIAVDGDL